MILACDLLKKKGEWPGAGDFEEKMTNLTKEIMEEKTELLGSYLKKWLFWWWYNYKKTVCFYFFQYIFCTPKKVT